MTRLWTDDAGSASTTLLSFAPLWFVVLGAFLMNVELGRHAVQRDVVDHAAALAADAASKTLCADERDLDGEPGAFDPSRLAAVRASIDGVLSLVSKSPRDCALTVRRGSSSVAIAAGDLPLDVDLDCQFACEIPIAAQAMCAGSPRHVSLSAHQTTVAMGCDVRKGL